MENQIEDKVYQPSDCLLASACREFFRGEKHIRICNRYLDILCELINSGGEYSEILKEEIKQEQFILSRFLFIKDWNNLFRNVYGNMVMVLDLIDEGRLDFAMQIHFSGHGFIYRQAKEAKVDSI